jgi:hypothetical protein
MRLALASSTMPRTTLDIDGSVLDELRRRSRAQGKSMGQAASELLAVGLAADRPAPARTTFAWRTADLGAPLVDLEDPEAVSRALEQPG